MLGQPSIFNAPQNRRSIRRPQHTFNVRHAPYEIQPFMIAPVLAGETMQGFNFQTRALTNPLKSSLIGWWLEHYWFYVRLTDIDAQQFSNEFREMLVSGAALVYTDYTVAASSDPFYGWIGTGSGFNYMKACEEAVVRSYFRDQDAAWSQYTIDGNPAAYLQNTTAFESAMLETAMDTALDVSIPVDAAPAPDTVSVRDIVEAMKDYERMYEQGLVKMTWEDYLRQEGIRAPTEDEHIPELIRFSRDWQYPSSFVVPDTVTVGDSDVTSAVSWTLRLNADKRRFFREPGFIFGVTCARPKVYLSGQLRPLVTMMDTADDWMPRVTIGSREAGWKAITDTANDVVGGIATGNWWMDLRDLFVFGDQFVAGDAITWAGLTDVNKMALPDASLDTRGPVQASVDAMFVSTDATGGIRQDGVTRLAIASLVKNLSPRGADVRLR